MPPSPDLSSSSPAPAPDLRASMLFGFASATAATPVGEAPLVLPSNWELLDLDQRVRAIGEW